MLKKTSTLLGCLLLTASWSMQAANEGEYDLQLVTVSSPTRSASENQRVIVCPNNLGDPVDNYTVGVIKNGTLLFEENVDKSLGRNEWRYDTLQTRVPMTYGSTDEFKVYLKISQEDIDRSNDTITYNVTMPELTDFPMEWNASKWKAAGLGWRYNESLDAFYTSGRKTNMMGSAGTVGVVNFPAGELVTCKFDYQASITGTYSVILNYGDSTVTVTGEMLQSSENYSTIQCSFVAAGPAMVSLTGSLPLAWNGYGTIIMRNITFDPAIKDVEITAITSPMSDKIAVNSGDVTIAATFKNDSPFDADDLKVSYKMGATTVTETIDGGIKSGQTLTHTFATPYTPGAAGAANLTVWCEAAGDGNLSNDTLSREINFYESEAFPFVEDFDTPNENWSLVDNNGDGHNWVFTQLNDGNGVAYYNRHGNDMDDYLITPAINMPQGKSRISFYYASLYGYGTARLRVLMGKTPSVADMSEVLFEQDITNRGWINGYNLIDLPEDGTYYFAFQAAGKGDGIVLDKLFIDHGEDICIDGITFDEKDGFNKTSTQVTISFKNHGVTPQKDIDVEYFVNTLEGTPVRETCPETVQPGQTVSYTFKQPLDISATDSAYTVIGIIASKIGVDQVNDSIVGQTLHHYSNRTLPYYNDFSDVARDGQWSFENGNDGLTSWLIASSYQALTNRICLAHNYVTTETPADDWAFSECIEIPKGEYEMSFFYRTSLNWDTEQYVQNFSAHLGTEPTASAMTTQLFKFENGTVGRPAYRKFINKITVPEDGKYYLGFHGYSPKNNGTTLIDCIELKPIEAGKELTYESDFTNKPEEWTRYNYTAQFNRWEYSGDGVDSLFVMSRNNDNKYHNYEGLLVSPKLNLTAGRNVVVEVEYSLETENEGVAFCLYGSSIDDPDQMQMLASSRGDSNAQNALALVDEADGMKILTYEFTPTADGDYFLGLRSNNEGTYDTDILYEMAVKKVRVYYKDVTGVDKVESGLAAISVNNGNLAITSPSDISRVELYDLSGRCVERMHVNTRSVAFSVNHLSGVYVVKATTSSGITTMKVVL